MDLSVGPGTAKQRLPSRPTSMGPFNSSCDALRHQIQGVTNSVHSNEQAPRKIKKLKDTPHYFTKMSSYVWLMFISLALSSTLSETDLPEHCFCNRAAITRS